MRANQFTAFAQQSEKEPDFLIDRLRSRLFPESLVLVTENHGFVRIDDHRSAEQSRHVADRILRECRAPIPENVAVEVFLCDLSNRADSLIAPVFDGVEPFFQFAPALLLRELGDCL